MTARLVGVSPPDIVFLHGLLGSGRNWTTVATSMSPLSSALVDLPNHGEAAWTDHLSYDLVCDDVATYLASLDEPPYLVGHSFGGRVAMLVGLRHPELLRGLVIEDTSCGTMAIDEPDQVIAAALTLPLTSLTSRSAALDQLIAQQISPTMAGFLLHNLTRRDDTWHWRPNLAVIQASLADVAAWPDTDALSFTGPVWWVRGGRSTPITADAQDQMRALFPAMITTTVRAAGHWIHAEFPEVFVSGLRRFIDTDIAQRS
ncbi:MAG: alpha/beta fold hydrolase [Propionibacteriaceae bacterium]|jgi:pimeloyl-ACP methyl ester carboxylesterase|nr:alpha/beta fold hydrolase [Propionibacteriaceae bacterium]